MASGKEGAAHLDGISWSGDPVRSVPFSRGKGTQIRNQPAVRNAELEKRIGDLGISVHQHITADRCADLSRVRRGEFVILPRMSRALAVDSVLWCFG
jgi:hypothetical protein